MKKLFASLSLTALMLSMSSVSFASMMEDTQAPSPVEGVVAEAYDSSVKLTWEAASDNTGVAGYQVHYGLTPVSEQGQVYDTMKDVGNMTSYTVRGLENDSEYFFSVVAYDAVGNESENWSPEVSATPNAEAGEAADLETPTVTAAEAMYKNAVKVEFSEEVTLEFVLEASDSFMIENEDTFEELAVTEAKFEDEEATFGRELILMTDEQAAGANYKLTVGADVKDLSGNPVISGTSDTALFVGSGEEMPEVALSVVSVETLDATTISLTFSAEVDIPLESLDKFAVREVANPENTLEISEFFSIGDLAELTLAAEMQAGVEYEVVASGLFEDDISYSFMGYSDVVTDDPTTEEPDMGGEEPAIKDVAKLVATTMMDAETFAVKLSWQLVRNENEKIIRQTLYTSEGTDDAYSETAVLDAEATEYELMNLDAGDYWFKLTQTNEAGEESEGTVTMVRLSETGPGLLGLALMSLGAGGMMRRRKI